jgi:hypothetical protein
VEANVSARRSFSLWRVKCAIRAVDRLQPGAVCILSCPLVGLSPPLVRRRSGECASPKVGIAQVARSFRNSGLDAGAGASTLEEPPLVMWATVLSRIRSENFYSAIYLIGCFDWHKPP